MPAAILPRRQSTETIVSQSTLRTYADGLQYTSSPDAEAPISATDSSDGTTTNTTVSPRPIKRIKLLVGQRSWEAEREAEVQARESAAEGGSGSGSSSNNNSSNNNSNNNSNRSGKRAKKRRRLPNGTSNVQARAAAAAAAPAMASTPGPAGETNAGSAPDRQPRIIWKVNFAKSTFEFRKE